MSEPTHDPNLTAVERALAGLAPSAGALNRDALMFAAGQRSARRGWAWPGAAIGCAVAAAVLGAILLLRPPPEPVERVVYVAVPIPPREGPPSPGDESGSFVETPSVPQASPPRQDTTYLALRQQAERWGDAGPAPPPRGAATGQPADVPAAPWFERHSAQLTPGGSP
jgi:hypothetical protein